MNRIRLFLLATVMSVAGLLVPQYTAKADMFGAVDASQLAAQIFQTIQDYDMDSGGLLSAFASGQGTNTFSALQSLFADIREKQNDISSILDMVSRGTQAFTSIRSVARTSNQILKSAITLTSYCEFLSEFGEIDDVKQAFRMLRLFNRRTGYLMQEVSRTLAEIANMRNVSGAESLSSTNQVLEQASQQIGAISTDFLGSMVGMVRSTIISRNVRDNAASATCVLI